MPDDELTRFASALLRIRRSRLTQFPANLFHGEQVWDFILTLFVADGEGRRLTGRMVIDENGAVEDVGRRWLQYVARLGYVVGDGEGHLDDPLTMTPTCLHDMELWLAEARSVLSSTMVEVRQR